MRLLLSFMLLFVATLAHATPAPRHQNVQEGAYADVGFTNWTSRYAVCDEGGGPGTYLSYKISLTAPPEQYTQSTSDGIYQFISWYDLSQQTGSPGAGSQLNGFSVYFGLINNSGLDIPASTQPFFVRADYSDCAMITPPTSPYHAAGFQIGIPYCGTVTGQTVIIYRPDFTSFTDDGSTGFTGLVVQPQGIRATDVSQEVRGIGMTVEGYDDASQFFGSLSAGDNNGIANEILAAASEAQLFVGDASDRCSNNGRRICATDADCRWCAGGVNAGGNCTAGSACPGSGCMQAGFAGTCGRGGIAPGKAIAGARLPVIQYYDHADSAAAVDTGDIVVSDALYANAIQTTVTRADTHVVGIAQGHAASFTSSVPAGTSCTANADCGDSDSCSTDVCVSLACTHDITACGVMVGVATLGTTIVNVDTAAVAIGDYLITSTTRGKATSNGTVRPAAGALLGIAGTAKTAGATGQVTVRLLVGGSGAQATTTPVLTPTPTATAALTPVFLNTPNTGNLEVRSTTTNSVSLKYSGTQNTSDGSIPLEWHDHVIHNDSAGGHFYDAHAATVFNHTIDVAQDPAIVGPDSGNGMAIAAAWTKGAAVTKALEMGTLHLDLAYNNTGAANDSMHGLVGIFQQSSGTLLDLDFFDLHDPVIVSGSITNMRAYRCRYTSGYCFYQESLLAQNVFAGVSILGGPKTPTPTPTKTSATSTPTPTPTPTNTVTATRTVTPTATITIFIGATPTSATVTATPTGTATPTPAAALTPVPRTLLLGDTVGIGPIFGALQVRDVACGAAPSTSAVNFVSCLQATAFEASQEAPMAQGGEVFGFVCSTNGAPSPGNYRIVQRINRADVPGECRLTGTGNPAICNVEYSPPVPYRKQATRSYKVTPDGSPTAINLKCQELIRTTWQ